MADGGLERVGIEAVAEGVDKFVKDLARMDSAYTQVGGASGHVASGASEVTSAFSSIGVGAVALGSFISDLALQVGGSLVNAFRSAVTGLGDFGISALTTAGSFQEMEFAALAVGQSMGISQDKTRAAIAGINDAGIRYDVAAKTVAVLAKNQIDLSKATDLANRAQGAGILIGQDSSATLERLIQGTMSGETETLKAMGIFINMDNAYKQYAQSIGKSIATLTEQEKTQARVDAVLENSTALMDVYSAAMESPTKRLRSLTERLLPELSAAVGAPFLSAFSTVVKSVSDFVTAITSAAQESGALYPVMVQLGAVASLIADGFASLVSVATDAVSGFSTTFLDGLAATAEGALRWGAEIVGALAQGFVEGAAAVLVPVMQFVGNLLAGWLMPGSPPKIAPWLPGAGAAAMTQYLSGFADADFDVLDKIQGALRSVLSGPDFARISQSLIETIGGSGAGRESFFTDLAESAGQFGAQIAELARRQFALADATKAVATAEKQYSDAQKNVETAQTKVSALTAEYNRMLRAGASKAALAAKLQEIRAAQGGLMLAQKQEAEAKSGVDSAKEKLDVLKEQASLQERLVKQLLDMAKTTKAMKAAVKAAPTAAAGAGAGAFTMPTPAMPTGLSASITSKIGEAIDKAKEQLKAKFADIFSPLLDVFKSPAFVSLKDQFTNLWGLIFGRTATRTTGRGATGEMIVEQYNIPGIIDKLSELSISFSKMIPPAFFDDLKKIGDQFGSMAAQLAIGQVITGTVAALLVLASAIGAVIATVLAFQAAFRAIPTILAIITTTLLATWETFKTNFTMKTQEIYNQTIMKFNALQQSLSRIWNEIAEKAIGTWNMIRDEVRSRLNELIGTVTNLATQVGETLVGGFNTFMDYMAKTFGPWLDTFTSVFIEPFRKALEFINEAIFGVIGAIEELKKKLSNVTWPTPLAPGSPTPAEIGLRGISDALRELSSIRLPALSQGLRVSTPIAARTAGTMGAPSQQIYRQANVNIGPNYISQDIDTEVLWAEIRRRILHEMRTA